MLEIIMSVADAPWTPSICTNREEYYAQLVQEYPDYHFFIMEVNL